ncbi:MAG: fibronectin/fibrinogen-binding protein [Firmicutes bacterium]|nr:fibronectin/fibrinogen-binding protein [Bacillota bacterium]
MAFDGVTLKAIADELRSQLTLARIDRVVQPEREEIHLLLRQPGRSCRLLISAHPERARIHLASEGKPNPSTPPLFCMVLRKHLEGGRVAGIEQPGLERVLSIRIEATNELGDPVKRALICEFMGKHSNIILLDEATNQILDGIRRYSFASSRYREVLPDRPYLAPPDQGKVSLLELDPNDGSLSRMLLAEAWNRPVWRLLFERLDGLSPLLARELVIRAGLDQNATLEGCGDYEFNRLGQAVGWLKETLLTSSYRPNLVLKNSPEPEPLGLDSQIAEYSVVPLQQFEDRRYRVVTFRGPSEMLEGYHQTRQRQIQWEKMRQELERVLDNSLEKAGLKLARREDSLRQIQRAEEFKLKGDLIMTYLYRIRPGMEEITLPGFDESRPQEIAISLSPQLTAVQNAQSYYQRYGKARRGLDAVNHYLEESRREIEYLETVSQSLTMSTTLKELEEIREELTEQGYLRRSSLPGQPARGRKPGKDRSKPKPEDGSLPDQYLSSDGYLLLVGKNNRQNDLLTMKLARREDTWLHAKDIPGAHVIIRAQREDRNGHPDSDIPPKTLEEAAQLAAYFSRGRHSSTVNIDYTQRRHVRKPGGFPPGKVIYDNHRTLLVRPEISPNLKKTD